MNTEQDYRMRLAWQTEERVELTRDAIEEELGPFECATDEDARCVLSTHAGAQFVAWLSGPEADARLNVEELAETDALRTCMTPEQLDGLACVGCGEVDGPMVPVGLSTDGGQLFAHPDCGAESLREVEA